MTRRRVTVELLLSYTQAFLSSASSTSGLVSPIGSKKFEISIKSMYKEHLEDEVEHEELAAHYSCETSNKARLEWMGDKRKIKLAGE